MLFYFSCLNMVNTYFNPATCGSSLLIPTVFPLTLSDSTPQFRLGAFPELFSTSLLISVGLHNLSVYWFYRQLSLYDERLDWSQSFCGSST